MGSAEPRSPHVLIIGAGMGGLFFAQFLRKKGISFSIFERDASLTARKPGWAIGLSMNDDFASFMPDDVPSLRDANHLLPLDLPSQVVLFPPGGARIGVTDTPETPCVRANRGKLRALLLTGLDVQWGKALTRFDEDRAAHTVTAYFEDGTSATGDLLVGADGTFSKTREHVLGVSNTETLQPLPMAMVGGETTLRYTAPDADGNECLAARLMRIAFSSFLVIRPGGTFFCGVDSVAPSKDAVRFYWLQYMRDPSYADPVNGNKNHWLRTATQQQKYDAVVQYQEEAGFDPAQVAIVRHGGPAAVTKEFLCLYDAVLPTLPTHGGRVFLIGDAAHPTTPFRGEGGIMAIKDALQLTDLLAEANVEEAAAFQAKLDALQDVVTQRGAEIVATARQIVVGAGGAAAAKTKPSGWGHEASPIPVYTGPLGLEVAKE
ncbi:hypothetical protein HMPREF1624_07105 [Sporothrix schenckii ATCC 58251]|uniref:FAD-binding domain-containing protein n=1 Tax=Sporothrix schenckii (strain ATCC 58251 / de Perez 2211183) TaxID=1391915 RepID=U7PMN1_SPOS1|nr:hypothetical protein HMPREF1624_07105 [Sporothrix schenckii ATCC 58251]